MDNNFENPVKTVCVRFAPSLLTRNVFSSDYLSYSNENIIMHNCVQDHIV